VKSLSSLARRACFRGLAALLCAAAMPLAAQNAAASKKIDVVATTGMLADVMRAVGGERVQVTALLGTGIDPHTHRQTSSDVARLTRADVVVYHGLGLEMPMEPLLKDLARRKTVAALQEAIPKEQLLGDEETPGQYDPHVWQDPALWHWVIEAGRDTLIKADPQGKAAYEAGAQRYIAQVQELNARIKTVLQQVPQASRVLVTAHDAFRYFARAYGYEVYGVQGISTESEAGLRRVEELVDFLVKNKIAAIFVETMVSDQNIRALIEGSGARGHKVSIGGELYSDSMGAPGTKEGSYLGMIEYNANTIARALLGQP